MGHSAAAWTMATAEKLVATVGQWLITNNSGSVTGNNQLKVMVASSGVDSRGGGGKQQRLTAIGSKTLMARAIVVASPTPLLSSLTCGGGQAAVGAARE